MLRSQHAQHNRITRPRHACHLIWTPYTTHTRLGTQFIDWWSCCAMPDHHPKPTPRLRCRETLPRSDCWRSCVTGSYHLLAPAPSGPAGHVADPRRRKSTMHARTAQPAVRPLSAKCSRSARPGCEEHRAPRRAKRRPCSRESLSTEPWCTRTVCRQSLGALDAVLCNRCLWSCIGAYEASTANSEFSESVRRAGMVTSARLLQITCPVI